MAYRQKIVLEIKQECIIRDSREIKETLEIIRSNPFHFIYKEQTLGKARDHRVRYDRAEKKR